MAATTIGVSGAMLSKTLSGKATRFRLSVTFHRKPRISLAPRAGLIQLGLPHEALLLLCNLIPAADFKPVLHRAGVTREVTVYEVDPATPINFAKSLSCQKSVSPLAPTGIGFQFESASDGAALDRVYAIVRKAIDEDLPTDIASVWVLLFPDGVRIPTMEVAHLEPVDRVAAG